MAYIEKIKELVIAFPYWQQAMFFAGGMICIYILLMIRKILRTRRYAIKNGRRSMVVIESRNLKSAKKADVNTKYFEYIKNAQYKAEKWKSAQDKESGIKLIK